MMFSQTPCVCAREDCNAPVGSEPEGMLSRIMLKRLPWFDNEWEGCRL